MHWIYMIIDKNHNKDKYKITRIWQGKILLEVYAGM